MLAVAVTSWTLLAVILGPPLLRWLGMTLRRLEEHLLRRLEDLHIYLQGRAIRVLVLGVVGVGVEGEREGGHAAAGGGSETECEAHGPDDKPSGASCQCCGVVDGWVSAGMSLRWSRCSRGNGSGFSAESAMRLGVGNCRKSFSPWCFLSNRFSTAPSSDKADTGMMRKSSGEGETPPRQSLRARGRSRQVADRGLQRPSHKPRRLRG